MYEMSTTKHGRVNLHPGSMDTLFFRMELITYNLWQN